MAEKRTNKTAEELREESKKSLKERLRGEPIKQNYGESAGDFRKRQKKEDDESPDNIKDRNIIGVAGQRVRTEGNKQIRKGTNYAKQVRENFENRMSELKEGARSEPIKQKVGESSYAFRRRQQKEDDESPDNIKDRSFKSVAEQRLRTGANKQIRKTLENNPRAAAAIARTNAIKKQVALKAQKFSNRAKELNAYAKKIKHQLDIKKRLEDELKKRIAQYAIRFLWPAIAFIAAILIKLLVVGIIVVVMLVAIDYTCNLNALTDAACTAVSSIGSWFGF